MNSYLETIKNLQKAYASNELIPKVTQYSTYEEYLHQQKDKRGTFKQVQSKYVIPKDQGKVNVIDQAPKQQTKIEYFPVERKQVQYKTMSRIQKVPKTKKRVEYVKKTQTQLVPKQVNVTDYYAVEHIRQYVKEIIPEVVVQTVTKPKIIKKVETVPVQKQIIFYPDYIQDIEEAKIKARGYLQEKGVTIKEDAQYRPMNEKDVVHESMFKEKDKRVQESLSPISVDVSGQKTAEFDVKPNILIREVTDHAIPEKQHFTLARPNHKSKIKAISSEKVIKTDISNIPIYKPEKYVFYNDCSVCSKKEKSAYEQYEYSFADRNQKRYEWAMHNSSKRLKR